MSDDLRDNPAVQEYLRSRVTPQFLAAARKASRTRHLSKRRRREIARAAAEARWERVRQAHPVSDSA